MVAMPQDLSSFAAKHKIDHVFCNNEFGINETKRDKNSSDLLKKQGILFSSFNDQVIYEPGFPFKVSDRPKFIFT